MIKLFLLSVFIIVNQSSFLLASETVMKSMIGKPFYEQKGETLAGSQLSLPKDFNKYSVTFVAIGLSRKAGDDFDSWINPFRQKYSDRKDVFFLSLPIIGKLPNWIVKQMKKGMKKGIDLELHNHHMIYIGDSDVYRAYYGLTDKKRGYFLLVNSDGVIIWQGEGKATKEGLSSLFLITDRATNR